MLNFLLFILQGICIGIGMIIAYECYREIRTPVVKYIRTLILKQKK